MDSVVDHTPHVALDGVLSAGHRCWSQVQSTLQLNMVKTKLDLVIFTGLDHLVVLIIMQH